MNISTMTHHTKVFLRQNHLLFIPILFFSALFLPFISSLPFLDGSIDFIQAVDFHAKGIEGYTKQWVSIHPPVKIVLAHLLFSAFGIHHQIFTMLGFISGIAGIIYLFQLTKLLTNDRCALITSLLLAINPLFLATGIFLLTDFMVTVFIVAALYYFLKNNWMGYAIATTLGVLTKETALILPLAVICLEMFPIIIHRKKRIISATFFYLFIPLAAFFLWQLFLKSIHSTSWGDWIFADTASRGSFYTIAHNIMTLGIFNRFAYQHWQQLFILNFNWILWLILLIGGGISIFGFIKHPKSGHLSPIQKQAIWIICLFCSMYAITVLTFQTYTIPRYALPIIPFLCLGVGAVLTRYSQNKFVYSVLLVFIGVISMLRLFTSVDPISQLVWGKTTIYNQQLYRLNKSLAGNDGLTYNGQYLLIISYRTHIIEQSQHKKLRTCSWLFPDPHNDYTTMNYLNIRMPICPHIHL